MFFVGMALAAAVVALLKGIETAASVADAQVLRQRVVERAKALGLQEDYVVVELCLPPGFDARLSVIVDGRSTKKEEMNMNLLFHDLAFGLSVAKEEGVRRHLLCDKKGENPIQALEGAWTAFANAESDEDLVKTFSAVSSAAKNLKGRLV